MVEFGRRHVDQEQNQYPNLNRGEAMPLEGRDHVRQETAQWIVFDEPETNEMFEQAGDEHDGPIEKRLEQDRPNQRRVIIAANRARGVGDEHCFSDDERRGRREHEIEELGAVIG